MKTIEKIEWIRKIIKRGERMITDIQDKCDHPNTEETGNSQIRYWQLRSIRELLLG